MFGNATEEEMQQENSQLERCSKVLREVTMIGKIIRNLLHPKCKGGARKNSWRV
jgi:hypothetical protein